MIFEEKEEWLYLRPCFHQGCRSMDKVQRHRIGHWKNMLNTKTLEVVEVTDAGKSGKNITDVRIYADAAGRVR